MLNPKDITILVVDDEPLTAKAVATNFEVFGFSVAMAESVADAEKIMAEKKIQIILLDWHMPNRSGEAFLKKIRSQDWTQPSVFIMSGDATVSAEHVFNLGADGLLIKPFDAAAPAMLSRTWMARSRPASRFRQAIRKSASSSLSSTTRILIR
jgi:DNA-binding response OmpR family regulator